MKKSIITFLFALVCLLNLNPAWAIIATPNLEYPADGDTAIGHTPQLKLQYQSNSNIREFELADNPSFTNSTVFSGKNSYVYVDIPFEFATTYYWRARIKSTNDSSAWTSAWSFTTSDRLHLLNPSPTSNNWLVGQYFSSNRTTDSFYLFEFDTSSTFSTGVLQRVIIPDTASYYYAQYNNAQLYFGKTYYWRGRSFTGTDSSGWSEVRSGITIDSVTLKSPNSASLQATSVLLKYSGGWLVNHLIELDTTDQFQSGALIRDTTFGIDGTLVKNLDFNTTYYWRVKMITDRDSTRWSQVRNFTTHKYDGRFINVKNFPNPELIVTKPELDSIEFYEFQYDTVNTFDSYRFRSSLSTGPDTLINLHFGDTCHFRYRAMHQKDTSAWCREVKVAIIEYPRLILPANNEQDVAVHDSIRFNSSVRGIRAFQVQYDTINTYNSPLAFDTIILADSAVFSNGYLKGNNFLFNQRYYLRIRMWHDEDTSVWSDMYQEHTFTTIARPILVKPFNGPQYFPGTDPLFVWNPIPGVPYYRVQLDTNQNFNSGRIKDTLVPASSLGTWSQHYLLFGTQYYWRVKAIESYDSSEWSDTWTLAVKEGVFLNSPKNNSLNFGPGNNLLWNSQSGTEGYILWLSDDSTFQTHLELTDLVNNSFFAYPPTNYYKYGTPYFWKVKVFHAKDTSEWSATWKFTTRERIAPSLVSPSNGAVNVLNSAKLSWTNYPGAESFRYELAKDSLFTQIIHNQVTTDTNSLGLTLQPSTSYYWHVIGRNSDGNEFGDFSETWSFTTDSGFKAPTLLSPTNAAILKVLSPQLSWSGDGGTYVLEVAESPSMTSPLTASTINEQITFTGLKYGKNYWWRVRSTDKSYSGPWSEIWTFTLQDPNGLESPENVTLLYPNPSAGSFTISGSVGFKSLTMYNGLGQQIPLQIEEVGESISVYYSDCSTGIYWVNWTDSEGIHQEKISVIGLTK